MKMTTESNSLAQISAYMYENRLNSALEAETFQNTAFEVNVENSDNFGGGLNGQTIASESWRLDFIYDDEPLGFEKDALDLNKKMQARDPLEEVDLGDGAVRRPTYTSVKVEPGMKKKVVELLKEFKDCFAWDYNEMPWLSRIPVELKFPI